MTPHQIRLVQASFAQIQPVASDVAALFYDQLFALDPALRRLFKGDMSRQGQALMAMIGWAVGRLDRPEQLLPALRTLGERHRGYGVEDHHYRTVGSALVATLEIGLGSAFTAELRAAWVAMYALVSQTMTAPVRQPTQLAA